MVVGAHVVAKWVGADRTRPGGDSECVIGGTGREWREQITRLVGDA